MPFIRSKVSKSVTSEQETRRTLKENLFSAM